MRTPLGAQLAEVTMRLAIARAEFDRQVCVRCGGPAICTRPTYMPPNDCSDDFHRMSGVAWRVSGEAA